MTRNFNPFGDLDFNKMLQDFKLPSLDADAMAGAYRKNVEAITEASQVAIEGMQAVAKRQAEIMRDSMQQYAQMLREVSGARSPEDATSKQAELAKRTFEKTLAQMRELGDMIAKSSNESIEVLNKRVAAMMDELKHPPAKKSK